SGTDSSTLARPEASIPFVDQRSSIRDWRADGTQGIWVQDAHRNWHYGKFHSSCFGLDFATAIGLRTGSTRRLDRFGTVVSPEEGRCPLLSFTTGEAPPESGDRRDGEDAGEDWAATSAIPCPGSRRICRCGHGQAPAPAARCQWRIRPASPALRFRPSASAPS